MQENKSQEEIKNKHEEQESIRQHDKYGISILLRIGMEMTEHAVIGVCLGLVIDQYFKTKPIFLLICLLISFILFFRKISKFF